MSFTLYWYLLILTHSHILPQSALHCFWRNLLQSEAKFAYYTFANLRVLVSGTKHGNWPKKSNAIAIEILLQKSNAILIMHYFCEKSNAIVEVIAIIFLYSDLLIICLFCILSGKCFHDFWCWLNLYIFYLFQAVNSLIISDTYYQKVYNYCKNYLMNYLKTIAIVQYFWHFQKYLDTAFFKKK